MNFTGTFDPTALAAVIELWQLLGTNAPRDLLLPKLTAAAEFSLLLRFPLFGRLARALEHGDPDIRSATLRLLAGATGPAAWKFIVAGLDDCEPVVRTAAVETLRSSAEYDPPRLVHGLFHPDPSVRRELCLLPWLDAGPQFDCSLLADEACRDVVLERLCQVPVGYVELMRAVALFADGQLDDDSLLRLLQARFRTLGYSVALRQLLREIVGDGVLAKEQIVEIASSTLPALQLLREIRLLVEVGKLPTWWESRVLAQLSLDEVLVLASDGPARPHREVLHLLQSARSERGLAVLHKTPSADALDDLLDHVWSSASDGLFTSPRWFDGQSLSQQRLTGSSGGSSEKMLEEFPQRLAAAILWAAHRHGNWHPGAAILCARIEPRLLIMPAVPHDIRQHAMEAILQSSDDGPGFASSAVVEQLICRQARLLMGLDLRLVAAFARLLPEKRIEKVVYLLGLPALVEAAREDPAAALPLFQLNDNASVSSNFLAAIADRRDSYLTIAARLAFSFDPEEWLPLVSDLSHNARVRIAIEVTRLELQGELPVRRVSMFQLGYLLGCKMAASEFALNCLKREWPPDLERDTPFARGLWRAIELEAPPAADSSASVAGNSPATPSIQGPPGAAPAALPYGLAIPDIQKQIAASTDLDALAAWCADDTSQLVEDAAFRLVELGGAAIARLAGVICVRPAVRWVNHCAWTISLWPAEMAGELALPIFADQALPADLRFVVGLNLLEQGHHVFDTLAEMAAACCREPWFTQELWDRLQQHGRYRLALRMVWAARPDCVAWAMGELENAAAWEEQPGIFDELLHRDPQRIPFDIAMKLWSNHGARRPEALPLLMYYLASDYGHRAAEIGARSATGDAGLLDELVTAVITVGNRVFEESKLLTVIENCTVMSAKIDALRRLILDATDTKTRENAANQLQRTGFSTPKLARVARTFAWGIRTARLLLNREFRIRILGTGSLGYTELEQPLIYVSAIPLLAGQRNGQDLVEGLILHELGHHVYHGTAEHASAWETAQAEQLRPLLNIVNDEHLERNLRGTNREYGDRLKKLAAYAFQHLERELPVELLLARLGHRAFRVLTHCRLKPARQQGQVAVSSREVLLELERAGASFPRFLRGLRMGLGNRHDDPKVAEGLALFGKSFRQSTAEEQLAVARKLREIFREESDLLDAFERSSAFPPLESQLRAAAEGLDDAALQAAVAEALGEGQEPASRGPIRGDGAGFQPQFDGINRSPDETFAALTNIVEVAHDPAAHAAYANRVVEQARRLRQFLQDLGRTYLPDRMRISGARFDSSRAAALVLRSDPRVMKSRKLQRANDLFLSVLVDCSGSMQGERLERAKLFATLVSEAVRGLSGIELRHFGFTDDTVYEAGNAARCAVHGLQSSGGNNDAGALWHAAKAGFRSRRRAKVLVMISDGSPTACSAGALRNLVNQLTRRHGMVCAQVAVAPPGEICFPYYVLLDPDNLRESVRRFGTIIASLVAKAMA